ncbi:MAG: hypothetical protein JWO31_637, partial [Phycisphaerales bacterium]|nr:hypothetical protein [Phycisphaerales bacterium]
VAGNAGGGGVAAIEPARRVDAVTDRGTWIWAIGSSDRVERFGTAADLRSGRVIESVPTPLASSANRSAVISRLAGKPAGRHPTAAITAAPAAAGAKAAWTFEVAGPANGPPPSWVGNDVLAVGGEPGEPGSLHRLDGATGRPRWAVPLPGPAYQVRTAELPNNGGGVLPDFPPAGEFGGRVWCLLADGRILLYDPATGKPRGDTAAGDALLAAPALVRSGKPRLGGAAKAGVRGGTDAVALAGRSRLRMVPLARFVGGKPDGARLAVSRARAAALLGLGRSADAVAEARAAAAAQPTIGDAHAALADVLEAAGEPTGVVAALLRAADLGHPRAIALLRNRYGLIARVPTGELLGPTVQAGQNVYAVEARGAVLEFDPARGPPAVSRTELPGPVDGRVAVVGDAMVVAQPRRRATEVRRFGAPPALAPDDPASDLTEPPVMPKEWDRRPDRSGPTARVGLKWYRPLTGGRVLATDGATVVEAGGRFPEIVQWRIATLGGRAVGLGTGGIYALGQDLSPAERIVDAGGTGDAAGTVHRIATDGRTVAVLLGRRDAVSLQIRTLDLSRVLRQTSVRTGVAAIRQPGQLVPLGGGYLAAEGELVWLSPDPAAAEWRFDRLAAGERWSSSAQSAAVEFGIPRVVGGRVVVPGLRDGLFVFDAVAITSRP